jgi:S1-C subfamily serine protease
MAYPQVVRVYATAQEPDYDCPWQSHRSSSSTGSGVLIGPSEILTGAHVVANSTFLQIQKIHDPNKVVATVKAICHDCDLALLTVSDEAFMEGIEPAQVGDLPQLRDKVLVAGFPVGGEEVSVTEGVVSRVEVQEYHHSQHCLLAVTVDAAINEGNSGGPVFKDNKVIGIAFQKLKDVDNIGEMVPAPIIKTFLLGIREDPRMSMPALGIRAQSLESPQLRRHLGLDPDVTGVLVNAVNYGGSCWGRLEPGDALIGIDGHAIANSGTIHYNGRHRVRFDAVLGRHQVGERIEIELVRQGRRQKELLELQPWLRLVPNSQYDRLPTYFVYGGLVFQPLSRNFLSTWGDWRRDAPPGLLLLYNKGVRTPMRQQVIILNQVLSDEINLGYEGLCFEWINAVNGNRPRHMLDFVNKLEQATGVVEIKTSSNHLIVMDASEVKRRNPRILERYHIVSDRSADLL